MGPSVTAVILNHNGRHLLEVSLPSLAAQTYAPLELVVVDDASSDDSLEYMRRSWPQVRVVELPVNVGVAAALNRGVQAAGGDLVALLNNDLELRPDWVAEMVAAIERHAGAGSCACKLLNYYERAELDSAGDGLDRSLTPFPRGAGTTDEGRYDREEEVPSATAGAALYRASALARVGPFDESFGAYLEDVDWGLRAQLQGFTCVYVPTAVGFHMKNATTGGAANPVYHGLLLRNSLALLIKDAPIGLIARNLRWIAHHQAGTFAHSVRHGLAGRHLRALASALGHAPRWLRARRAIQRSRSIDLARLQALLSDGPGEGPAPSDRPAAEPASPVGG
jgi:GT2 family glycosyltransferase